LSSELFLIFIFYSLGVLIFTYYFNNFLSQTSDNSLISTNPLYILGNIFKKISSNYSVSMVVLLWFFSAFIAMLLLFIATNWIINSAIIPLIVFFAGSKAAIYFEETKVTISESSSNIIETIYARYYRYIISGFLSGFATKLLDNWINIGAISFLWFLINFLIITIIIALVLKEDIFD